MTLDAAVMFAGATGDAFVCGLLVRRRMWQLLPFFCAYAAWSLATDLAAPYFLWKLSPFVYGRFYFGQSVLDSVLQFAVLGELAWSVLRPVRGSLPRHSRTALYVLVALAGLAIWPLAAMTMPPSLEGWQAILFHLQETFAILRVACFLILASFSQLLAIGWRDRELQVATGLGFYSIASLIVAVLHTHQTWGTQYHLLDEALSISYLGTLTFWIFSFATKEQERKEFSPQMQQLLVLMGGGARAGRIALGDLPPEPSNKRIK